MSKTITIIELFNKIANGEEVPKKIKFHGLIFEFDELEREYIHNDNDLDMTMDGLKYSSLIDKAEIIEDEETIDIDSIEEIRITSTYGTNANTEERCLFNLVHTCEDKINDLIKAVKQINRKLEDK